MKITINGEERSVPGEMGLSELLGHLGMPTRRIAVEVNRSLVKKKDWERLIISKEDVVEIIHFVGGG